jgi:hypothetical protein
MSVMTGADLETSIASSIAGSLAGDRTAWMHLLGELWEQVDKRVRNSRRMGQLRGSADDRREVVSRVFAKLRRNEFRALRHFSAWRARNPDKRFDDWLTIVTTNAIRDHVTLRLGAIESGVGLKRLVNTLAESIDSIEPGQRPAITDAITARELLVVARERLLDDQYNALGGWLAGCNFDEIGATYGWTAMEARAKVRAALARLRREVRGDT